MDQFLGLFSLKLELIYWKRCSLSKTSNLTPLAIYGGGVLPAIMLVSIVFIRNLCNCLCQKHWFWLIINSIASTTFSLQSQNPKEFGYISLKIYFWMYIFLFPWLTLWIFVSLGADEAFWREMPSQSAWDNKAIYNRRKIFGK